MKEESQLTEESLNSCQEKSIPIFFTDKAENKERLGKKKKGSLWGEEQDSWRDCFLCSILKLFHRSFFHILSASKKQLFKKFLSTFFLTLSFTATWEENTAVLHLVTQECMKWLCDVCSTQVTQKNCE